MSSLHVLGRFGSSFGFAVLAAAVSFSCGGDPEASASGSGATGSGATGSGGESTGATGGAGGGAGGGSGGDGAGGTNTPSAAKFPLELVSPRAAGSAPSNDPGTPAMPSGHRIFKAYPGLEYNIRAVVVGGSYPFTYSLSNAPAGMVIDAATGEISWPDPTGASATPTITVRDSEDTELSESWTITVTTEGFRFVDAVDGNDAGQGTLASPWRTLSEVKDSGAPGQIVYFRSGTYTTEGMALSGGDTWQRVEFTGTAHPVQWIAYPGEAPVIDNEYTPGASDNRFIRLSGSDVHPVYLDGFSIINSWDKGLQYGSWTDYGVFRRLSISDIAEAIDGSNPAGIMTLSSYGDAGWYTAYQDNDFHDNAAGGIKLYSHKKVLWEDCLFRDSGGGPDLKSHVPRFEVRGSTFANNAGNYCGLFGNMNFGGGGEGEAASGEIRHNLVLCGPEQLAMDVNQDGMAGEIFLYRNTFVGRVRVRNTDSADGPFHFENNVIVNDDTDGTDQVWFEAVEDPSRVTFSDNLVGTPADGVVDASGSLQGEFLSYLGTHGHQIP